MSIQTLGLKAYNNALSNFVQTEKAVRQAGSSVKQGAPVENSFASTLENSLSKVNELHGAKSRAVESFASGENQNVHELMISLQKAGLAMSLTSAVRNKVLEAYRELSKMQF